MNEKLSEVEKPILSMQCVPSLSTQRPQTHNLICCWRVLCHRSSVRCFSPFFSVPIWWLVPVVIDRPRVAFTQFITIKSRNNGFRIGLGKSENRLRF